MNGKSRQVMLVVLAASLASIAEARVITWTGLTNGNPDGNWTVNAANKNWTDEAGAATSYVEGDSVVFPENIAGTSFISIQRDGVTPKGLDFRHGARLYTLGGGPIKGDNTSLLLQAGAVGALPGGTLQISNRNTFGGGTTVTGGFLEIGDNAALGAGKLVIFPDASISAVGAARTLSNKLDISGPRFGGGQAPSTLIIGGEDMTFTGAMELNGAPTFVIRNSRTTFSGVVSDGMPRAGGVIKSGRGTLVLSGANTYTAGTAINGGILFAALPAAPGGSPTGTGPVTVNKGGTLGGVAPVKGKVIVNGGEDLRGITRAQPEGGTGEMTLAGGLEMAAGGLYAWALGANSDDGPGVNFDRILLTGGDLVLGNEATLAIVFTGIATPPNSFDSFWRTGHVWQIIDAADASQNLSMLGFTEIENAIHGRGTFTTFVGTGADAGDIFLRFSVMPEPSGLALTLFGAAVLLGCRRRAARRIRPAERAGRYARGLAPVAR